MFYDISSIGQWYFQSPGNILGFSLISFHDYLMIYIFKIGGVVLFLLIYLSGFYLFIFNVFYNRKVVASWLIEFIWTLIPFILLFLKGLPSFELLYLLDFGYDSMFSVQVGGNQWFWSVSYPDLEINFDKYKISEHSLNLGSFRNLEVDNEMCVPINSNIRLIVYSYDVIHSLALPSLGVKIDCTPGRINFVDLNVLRVGSFYGQCSELCGVYHGFKPFVCSSKNLDDFIMWLGLV